MKRIYEEDIDGVATRVAWNDTEPIVSPKYSKLIPDNGTSTLDYLQLISADVDRFAILLDGLPATARTTEAKRIASLVATLGYLSEYLLVPVPAAQWHVGPYDYPSRLHVVYIYSDPSDRPRRLVEQALWQPYLRIGGRPIIGSLIIGRQFGNVSRQVKEGDSIPKSKHTPEKLEEMRDSYRVKYSGYAQSR